MKDLLKILLSGKSFSEAQASETMTKILSGAAQPEQIGALLAVLNMRPPTTDELVGFVSVLRANALLLNGAPALAIDVCGTGGDGLSTFNVSTTVAFVLGGAGQIVAKHGNRSVSSRCGSFDVLEALGVEVAQDVEQAKSCLDRHGLTFLFAPSFHPTLGLLAPLRRNLGVRTVFNALGPLLNPAGVRRQLIGVYSADLLVPMAEALGRLGAEEALIVRGEDGTDEISIGAPTRMAHLRNGRVSLQTIRPEDVGLKSASMEQIAGGDAAENARLLRSVLEGQKGPLRDIVLLNTAGALLTSGAIERFADGIERAADAIDSGRALALLEAMKKRPIITDGVSA